MAGRLAVIVRHTLAHVADEERVSMSSVSAGAPITSPTGREYPPGTAVTLKGNMEPATLEVEGDLVLIHGSLPVDIDGQFIRNGPNSFLSEEGNPDYHEFRSDGMLHASDLKGGSGTYKNRWVRTDKIQLQQKLGRPLRPDEMRGTGKSVKMGSANTALVYHASKLLALCEPDKPYVISPGLETVGQMTYDGRMDHPVTAHPKVCPKTGELIFFGYDLMRPLVYYSVADKQGKLVRTMKVPTQCGKPVMMHDMAITERYSLLLEFPLCFDMEKAMKGQMPFMLDAALPSKFGILPRHAASPSEIRWFEGESAYAFHTVNAWEEGSLVKLVGCRMRHFSFEYEKSSQSLLHEWTFDLATGKTSERQLDDTTVEFPVINPRTQGLGSRYAWAAIFTDGPPSPLHGMCGCMKYDLFTGSRLRHDFLGGRWGGESVFVPRSTSGGDEDDGYLMTYTFNPSDNTTELYIVDARTMDADPVAILRTPQRVPFGFHGTWLPRDSI